MKMTMTMAAPAGDDHNAFACDEPGCFKRFKRSDHLLRHKKNHQPEPAYNCSWPGCEKSFVRKDVRLKHYKKHMAKAEQIENSDPTQGHDIEPGFTARSISSRSSASFSVPGLPVGPTPFETFLPFAPPGAQANNSPGADPAANPQDSVQYRLDSRDATLPVPTSAAQSRAGLDPTSAPGTGPKMLYQTSELEMTNLIEWLMDDTRNSTRNIGFSPLSSVRDLLGGLPDLAFSASQTFVLDSAVNTMATQIPELGAHPLFTPAQIERCLARFWAAFHPQLPIVSRPTFSSESAHPLLLLAMVGMGACFVSKQGDEKFMDLANSIFTPLRGLVCNHPDCYNSWGIQSLVIVECFESLYSSRQLHTRANLNHGFKIELLRRSSVFSPEHFDRALGAWDTWLELESLKRCAFACFLHETHQRIVFGHEPTLYTHNMATSLPCPDHVWLSSSLDRQLATHLNSDKFFTVLAKMLTHQKVTVSPFVKNILLAGIISLILHNDSNDVQLGALLANKSKLGKKTLLLSLDSWYDNVADVTCMADCNYYFFHISQSFLRVSQYDCIIYAGAPKRMNVSTSIKDYEGVSRRVYHWANSLDGRLSLTHAYLVLMETLADKNYHPNNDILLYRPNIVALCLLLVWDYTYCLYGPESQYLENVRPGDTVKSDDYPEQVSGTNYIESIKRQFDYEAATNSGISGSRRFALYANSLPNIENKHLIVGFLRLFKQKYLECDSQLCREYGRLMENCIQRSLGRRSVTCVDMLSE